MPASRAADKGKWRRVIALRSTVSRDLLDKVPSDGQLRITL
jgi:hypothetical protein